MISNTLVQWIETHWAQISAGIERDLACDADLAEIAKIEGSFRKAAEDLVRNLGEWLAGGEHPALAEEYEQLGAQCYQRGIPPHLLIRAVTLCKRRIQNFVREEGFPRSVVEIYVEEELELRVDRFFDCLTFWAIRGHWEAGQASRQSVREAGKLSSDAARASRRAAP